MPTYAQTDRFRRDFAKLTPAQKADFRAAAVKFVADLQAGQFRPELRVTGVQGTKDVFEMTWADDGRATFEYGTPARAGETHVVWRRVGSHDIFARP